MTTWGRPPSCSCGQCPRCKTNKRAREQYRAMTVEQRRAWRARRDADRVRAADKRRHEKRKLDPAAIKMRHAISMVNNAIRDGRLTRQPCEQCGTSEHVHGHHDDYGKPLDVRWVCSTCHAAEHAPEAAAA